MQPEPEVYTNEVSSETKTNLADTLTSNFQQNIFVEDSLSPIKPKTPCKDKHRSFRDNPNGHNAITRVSPSKLRMKHDGAISKNSSSGNPSALASSPFANITLVQMMVRIMEKNEAYVSLSSPNRKGMRISHIMDELAIEFPFMNDLPHDAMKAKFYKVLDAAYFPRSKDGEGRTCWSFNKKRYMMRGQSKAWKQTITIKSSKLLEKFAQKRSMRLNARKEETETESMRRDIDELTIGELTIAVFLEIPTPRGYSAEEVFHGVKILFPTRNTTGLSSAIEEELKRNKSYSKVVPSICTTSAYKLEEVNFEKCKIQYSQLLEKCRKQPIQLAHVRGSLHTYCKWWSRMKCSDIPEEDRGETELTAIHVLIGVLLISPPGKDYVLSEIIERVNLVYPNHTLPNIKLDLSRQIYKTDMLSKRSVGRFDYYCIDKEIYGKFEARRAFLHKRLPELNLTQAQLEYLLIGKKHIKPKFASDHEPSAAAISILADMGIGKHLGQQAKLPSFRKHKRNHSQNQKSAHTVKNGETI